MKTFSSFFDYLQDYKNVTIIGVGTYGQVYEAERKQKKFAFKFQLLKKTNSHELDMQRIKHPNIISFSLDTIEINKQFYLVYKMPLGLPLNELDLNIPRQQKWKYIYDIACALSFLNEIGYYHCDLKPANIVIIENRAILIDFSLLGKGETSVCNTSSYRPLEFYQENGDKNAQKADSWAFGCLIAYMFLGKNLFARKVLPTESYDKMIENQLQEFFKNPNSFYSQLDLNSDELDFIKLFFKKDPNQRIAMQDVFDTKLFKKMNFKNPHIQPPKSEHAVYIPYDYDNDNLYQQEMKIIKQLMDSSSFEEEFHTMDIIYRSYPFFKQKSILYLAYFLTHGYYYKIISHIEPEELFDYFLVLVELMLQTGGIYSKTIVEETTKMKTLLTVKSILYNKIYSNSNYKERKELVETLEK